MSEFLRNANQSIDRILAYGIPPDQKAGELNRFYTSLGEGDRHALFLAVCARLLVEIERSRQRRVKNAVSRMEEGA